MVKINQRGITLIALVITIIVLLILAGVTINKLLGQDGIINRTQQAKEQHEYAAAKEIIDLKLAEIYTDAVSNNEEYTMKKITTEMDKDTTITTEQKYFNTTASLKSGVSGSVDNLKGIVVSVDQYSRFKFLVSEKNGGIQIIGYTTETVTNAWATGDLPTGFIAIGENKQVTPTTPVAEEPKEPETPVTTGTTVNVSSSTAVGEAVEYNIPYTDVFTGTEYTKDNGWLFLSKTEEGNGKYTVNLMSAGLPAKVHYHYTTNVPGSWWGSLAQVRAKYGDTYADAGYVYVSESEGGYPNYFAAAGLEENFESITFAQGTTAVENGAGCYTSINGTSSGNVTGAIFKVAGDNVSVHDMTETEANSLTYAQRTVGTGSSYYWLSSPDATNRGGLRLINRGGGVGYSTNAFIGVRPVVSITGVSLDGQN